MWKVFSYHKAILFLCFNFIVLTTIIGQDGIKPFINRHPLQSTTARAKFQSFFISENGLIYIATSEGIILFNGQNEKLILGSEQVTNQQVKVFVQDRKGILWIGCQNGAIYFIENTILQSWKPQEGQIKTEISALKVDSMNQLWIATKGEGVYVYNHQHVYNFGIEDGLKSLHVNDMAYHPKVGILVASDEGLQALNFHNESKNCTKIEVPGLKENDIIQNVKVKDNLIYLNSLSAGIYLWNPDMNTSEAVWKTWNKELISHFEISTQQKIILTENIIYFQIISDEKYSILKDEVGLDEIVSTVSDEFNNVWILHKSKGLISIFFPITQFMLPGKTIQCIARSITTNDLLAGTTKGLYVLDPVQGRIKQELFSNENITSIFSDRMSDNFWIGTYGGGIHYYNHSTSKSTRFKQTEGLPNNHILQIIGDPKYIWISTLGGIVRLSNRRPMKIGEDPNFIIYNASNLLPTNFIYQLVPDEKSTIWIGTDGHGVLTLKDSDTYFKSNKWIDSLSSIFSLDYQMPGFLYFNAMNKGLGQMDLRTQKISWLKHQFKYYDYECISKLNDSILLAAGNGYLVLFNTKTGFNISLDEEYGLSEIQPSLNASFIDNNGICWIGCKDKIIRFHPATMASLKDPVNSFSKIQQFDQVIQIGLDTTFSYSQNQFYFEFNAVHFLASDHIEYRYKLDGYDSDWILSKEGKASYSKLLHGRYTFIVQSSINNQFNTANQLCFSFEIQAPYWKQGWFVFFVVAGIIFSFFYLLRRREIARTKEDTLKRKTSELEFELLKSQVNPHFLFNSFNSVISLIEEDSTKAIAFTEKLSDYFRNILKYRDLSVISLDEELSNLKNYYELLKLRYPEHLELDLNVSIKSGKLVPMTLQLLLENALKHNELSKLHPLKISILVAKNQIVFTNSINKKRHSNPSTGFGLDSIRFRYKLLTDQAILVEEKDSLFSVTIPIIF